MLKIPKAHCSEGMAAVMKIQSGWGMSGASSAATAVAATVACAASMFLRPRDDTADQDDERYMIAS